MTGPIIDDLWKDLLGPLVAIVAVVGVAGAYKLGWLGELPTAAILALVTSGVVFVLPFFLVEAVIPRAADKAAILFVGLGTTSIFLTAVFMQLFPGEPLAKHVFRGETQAHSLTVEPGADIRVVVRTDPMGRAKDRLPYTLHLERGEQRERVAGALVRPRKQQRGQPGQKVGAGKASGPHGAESKILRAPGAPGDGGPVQMRVVGAEALKAGLYVDVFPARCPRTPLLVAQLALLGLALIVRRRVGHVSGRVYLLHLAVTGSLLAYNLPGALTPETPVMPLFGSIVVALIAGGLLGELLSWLSLRGVRKRVV